MSAKANPTRIGFFVVGAILLLMGSVVAFGSGKLFQKTERYVAFFDGSLTGLDVGAPVTFRGVPIGSVTEIQVQYFAGPHTLSIPVFFEMIPGRLELIGELTGTREERMKILLDKGLRAQLVSQSLVTGQLAIQVDFMPDTPLKLVGDIPDIIEFPTVPSTAEEIMSQLKDLKLDELVASSIQLINDVDALLTDPDTAKLIPELIALASDAKGLVSHIDDNVQPISQGVLGVTDAAKQTLNQGTSTIAHVDAQVSPAITELRRLIRDMDARVPKTLAVLEAVLVRADGTLKPDSELMRNLNRTLSEFSNTARSVRKLADELERDPSVLIRGK